MAKLKKKNNMKFIMVILAIICLIGSIFIMMKNKSKNNNFTLTPEIIRSREYEKVKAGDEETASENVTFDVFFLRDIDGDGNADPIRGTCNEVGKEDTLYMELRVLNQGYLKNGLITINSDNFYLNTTLVKDETIARNYISSNTKSIKLNDVHNGTQKLINSLVRSGDYSSELTKTSAIGKDTNKYSKVNSVRITGTYVNDNGEETPIDKTINFNVDWYGETNAQIYTENYKKEIADFAEIMDADSINLNFTVETYENQNKLILKSSVLSGVMPELNGYKPSKFMANGANIEYTYNDETGKFLVRKDAVTNENDTVTQEAWTTRKSSTSLRFNQYEFYVEYPIEAYQDLEQDMMELYIPVETYYEGYNNPNEPFDNPYISNIARSTLAYRWIKTEGDVCTFRIYVGQLENNPYYRYVVSKNKPYKIYNNISESEVEDYYTVTWKAFTGRAGNTQGITMKETKNGESLISDDFIKVDNSRDSMEALTSNTGIYFVGADSMLGDEGFIKIYNDETDELIVTFTKENWNNYTKNSPYKYENPVKHIRIETSITKSNSTLYAYNIKELDDEYITTNYTLEEFEELQHIRSTLVGYYGSSEYNPIANTAIYEAPLSVAKISLSNSAITTQETTENEIITISTETSSFTEQKWINGIFLVKIPSEIISMQINNVTCTNQDVSIVGYDLYEENGNYFVKIITENENEASYDIKIDCNLTPDPRNTTASKEVELYAKNEQAVQYYKNGNTADIYDIDGNSNTEEIINKASTGLSIISPNALLTNQIVSSYDETGNITISPKVADVDKKQRTATIEINLTNNYAQPITDVLIQGVIPFENNEYIIGNRNLGSEYSTWISNSGIEVPEALRDYVTIYYSENEKPSKDLTDTNNGWTLAENVTDWTKVKTFIIDLGDYVLQSNEARTFKYQVNIPEGIEYNKTTYSEHAIYFSLMTENGKYSTSTAANKVGIMIAKQYDLEITKYQENTGKVLPGITFTITDKTTGESKIKTTDSSGKLTLPALYAEREYTIKEIRTTSDYVLNDEEITFYTYIDSNNNLNVVYKNENNSYTSLEDKYSWLKSAIAEKNNNEDYKVKIDLENEPKARLKIEKVDESGNKLSGVKFKLTGKEKNGVNYSTNSNGEIQVSGLYLNETYTLEETKAKGYYLPEQNITFKIKNDLTIETTGNIVTSNVTREDEIPTINIKVQNEKIPEYSLRVVKKEKDEETVLKGAQFKISGEDQNENTIYKTDDNGILQIDNLYEYIDGKNVEAKYTLKEIYAPEGYVTNPTPIVFKATRENNELHINVESGTIKQETNVDYTNPNNPIIEIIIENSPIFTLTKVDSETNEPLEGVKFEVTDTEGNVVTDVKGNTLNSVTTDANGKARLSLPEGLYNIKEKEANEGYELDTKSIPIGIGASQEGTMSEDYIVQWENNKKEYISYIDITTVKNNSGNIDGVIALGEGGQVTKYNSSGDIEWINREKNYVYPDQYTAVTTVTDGVIAVGTAGQVVKYDLNGSIKWENTLEGHNYSGVTTVEDGVIAVGLQGKVVKYDLDGNLKWEKTDTNYNYTAVTTVKDNNGDINGVIAVGTNGQVVKYDDLNGELKWENTLKSYRYNDVIIANDEIIVIGEVGRIVKYDLSGTFIWEKKVGLYSCVSITPVATGMIAVGINGRLVKYDIEGNIQWEKTVEEISSSAGSITTVADGVIVAYGDGRIIKYDDFNGNLIWKNTEKISYAYYETIAVTDGVIALGSYGHVVKYDLNGNIEWENSDRSYNYIDVTTVADGVIAVSNNGQVVKYDLEGNLIWENTDRDYYYYGITTVEDGVITVGYQGKIVKYDLEGNLIWENTDRDYYYYGVTTVEDGVIAVSYNGQVVKYDLEGNLIWENTDRDYYYYGVTTVEDGIVAVGYLGQVVKYDFEGNFKCENTEKTYDYVDITASEDGIVAVAYSGQVVKYGPIEISPEYPELQSIEIKNVKKKVKITTDVKEHEEDDGTGGTISVKGGTISGEDLAPYEEVKYGDDSVNPIKAIPEPGYSVLSITVNGENISFTEEDDGSVILSKFVNMTEDKNVVVEFGKGLSEIKVNHYLWTETSGTTTTKVSESENKKGPIGENYITTPITSGIEYEIVTNKDFYKGKTESEILSSLEVTSITEVGYDDFEEFYSDYYIPSKATGTFTDEIQTINYYYKEKEYSLIVNYYIEGTETRVPDTNGDEIPAIEEIDQYKNGDSYSTTEANNVDTNKYELVETPENATGTITEDTIVNYYYRIKDGANIVVQHNILGTNNKVPSNTTGTINDEIYNTVIDETTSKERKAKVGDNYTTSSAEGRIASNYRIATNKEYYESIGEELPNTLNPDDNYIPANATGSFADQEQTITYFYVQIDPDLTNSITITGTERITNENQPVNYTINYETTVKDYVGDTTITIIDSLPYHIDVTKSNLDGGTYDPDTKTITWQEYYTGIDTYTSGEDWNKTITKNISVVYTDLDYSVTSFNDIVSGKTYLIDADKTSNIVQDNQETVMEFNSKVIVKKVWDDNNNSLGIRPTSINVELKAKVLNDQGVEVDYSIPNTVTTNVTLNSTNGNNNGDNWTYTWNGLAKYNEDGKEINYYAEEKLTGNVRIAYTTGITEEINTEDTLTSSIKEITIKNTYTEPTEKINLVVNKVWNDNDNANNKRPSKVKFVVKNGTTEVASYTLNTSSENSHTFELLKYDNKGNEISYSVEEQEVEENDLYFYNTSIGNITTTNVTNKYTVDITNTFNVPDEKISIKVNKIWNDNNNENEKRPSQIRFILNKSNGEFVSNYVLTTAAESNYTFANLDKYDDKGDEITYIVSEEEVNNGGLNLYTTQISGLTEISSNSYEVYITNTFTVPDEKIEIEVTKIWEEQNETQKQKRPTSVKINLKADREQVATRTLSESNHWKETFTNLAKYTSTGNEINYRIEEEEIAENDLYFYTKNIGTLTKTGENKYKVDVTNTFNVPDDTIEKTVTKTWEDNSNEKQNRLNAVNLILTGNGQTFAKQVTSKNEDSTNSNNWIYTFTGLPKFDENGQEIEYKLTEQEVNAGDLNKYKTEVNGYTVTNTLIIKDVDVSITGTKQINSLEDTIDYKIDYQADISTKYTENSTITIVDTLPYKIDTTKPYDLNGGTYDEENKTITWIGTYSYTDKKITWSDGTTENVEEKIENENYIINTSKNISVVFKDIDLNEEKMTNNVQGKIRLINNTESEDTDTFDTIFKFSRDIKVIKIWKGDEITNKDGSKTILNTRPTGTVVQISKKQQDGTWSVLEGKEVTLKMENNWEYEWKDMPRYDLNTREEIEYKVTEKEVPKGYYKQETQENDTFTIINSKYGSITITKVDHKDNNIKLGGAEFKLEKLKEENGKLVVDKEFTERKGTTEKGTGEVKFEELEYGKYKITETKAPEGYSLVKNLQTIEITENSTGYKGEISNKQKAVLPLTGGMGAGIGITTGILMLIIVLMVKKNQIYVVKVPYKKNKHK